MFNIPSRTIQEVYDYEGVWNDDGILPSQQTPDTASMRTTEWHLEVTEYSHRAGIHEMRNSDFDYNATSFYKPLKSEVTKEDLLNYLGPYLSASTKLAKHISP